MNTKAMNIKAQLKKLEEKARINEDACPHLPPIVKYFEPDGTQDTSHGVPDETPCSVCKRDRLRIHVQYVETPRAVDNISAKDLTDDQLAAIIRNGAQCDV